ncbi:hypothetical protein ACSLBF_02380 [Pseudoalteromonas sp. T1lg65]|uniref:hypothetical protein n=1 Tax=Pseudoalteromonas sp. T1lg65 TaxID=2077101 RepID=UPI003F7A5009
MAKLDQLFEAWLDGKTLSEQELELLQQDNEYRQLMAEARGWQEKANQYQDVPTPRWLKHVNPLTASWLQVASYLLVGLGIVGLWLQNVDLNKQLQQQNQLIATQQQVMKDVVAELKQRSVTDKQALSSIATQVVAQTRKERGLEINNLVDFMQAQRAQDQALLRLQLNELEAQVDNTPVERLAKY